MSKNYKISIKISLNIIFNLISAEGLCFKENYYTMNINSVKSVIYITMLLTTSKLANIKNKLVLSIIKFTKTFCKSVITMINNFAVIFIIDCLNKYLDKIDI